MTPLGAVALGLLVVTLDLRITGTDLLVDLVGWMIVVTGLTRLALLERRFSTVRRWAIACVPLSLVDLTHPQDPNGTTALPPEGAFGALSTLYGVVMTVAVVLLALALRDRARRYAEPALAARFHLLALLQGGIGLLLGVVGLLALVIGPSTIRPEGPAAVATVVLVLAVLGVHLWFLLTLAGARARPWLQTGTAADDEHLTGEF